MSRLPATSRDDLPENLRYVWDRLVTGSNDNVMLALANNGWVLRDWARLNTSLWTRSDIDPMLRELVILRVAWARRAVYEWHQHVRISRSVGFDDDRILAVRDWRTSDALSPAERAVLAYADALLAREHPSRGVLDEVAEHFDPFTQVGLTVLVGFYEMTATFLDAMEVETEQPFVGWDLRGSREQPA